MTDTTAPQAPAAPGARPWLALGLLTLVFILANIDRNILAILLEGIRKEFALADWQLGLLSGFAFSLLYGVGGLFVSYLADRGNRARIITISLAVWSVMTALCGMAGSFATLVLARAGVGLGESGCSPPAHSLISDLFPPERRALALGVYAAGASIGLTSSYLLGGWLAEAYGWRVAFIAIGLIGLPVALIMHFLVKDHFRRGPAEPLAPRFFARAFSTVAGHVWSTGALRHVFIAASLAAGVSAATIMFVPAFLIRTHGLTPTETGLALGLLTGLIGSSGIVLGGWLADRLTRRDGRWALWIPALGKLLALPGLALFFLVPHTGWALAAYALPSFVSGVWLGPTYAVVQGLVPAQGRAMAAALLLLTYNLLGFGLGPLLIGGISDLARHLTGGDGLALALLCLTPFSVWSAIHYLLAARRLETAPGGH
ncbi:MAG: spinster family MFS transporter [Caulobacter sp.]|jgi:MFS family permease